MPSKLGKFFHRPGKVVTHSTKPQQSPAPPGDIPKALTPGVKVQPEEIRNLLELIRKRYELDIEIWGLRHVRSRDRPIVEDKMRRSDALLRKIIRTVYAWDNPGAFHSQQDWAKLREIRTRIEEGGKREWKSNPPWEEQVIADRSIAVA